MSQQQGRPQIGVLVDPLIREGAAVSSQSYVGRLVTGLLLAAEARDATVLMVSPGQRTPPVRAWILLETGSRLRPPQQSVEVPVICAGVAWDGWDQGATATCEYPFTSIVAGIMNDLVTSGSEAPGFCCPQGEATWLAGLTTGYRSWCERTGRTPRITSYDRDPESARAAGAELVRSGADGVFHISNRLQREVVEGVRSVSPDIPLTIFGEGVDGASFDPPVGVLSLEPNRTSTVLIDTALTAINGGSPPRRVELPWTFTSAHPSV